VYVTLFIESYMHINKIYLGRLKRCILGFIKDCDF
jgi:hypothetical protein